MRFPLPRLARQAALIVAAMALGACTTKDGSGFLSPGTGGAPAEKQYTMADFTKSTYCPPLQLRPGTEAMTIYERGHDGEPNFVRQQASITKTARECGTQGGTLTMKVGVGGRVLAGPKGGPGTVTLPIRVAVVKQTEGATPLYTNLYKVPITVSAPSFGTNYDEVFTVSVPVGPEDRDLIVFVGFDEGK
jgi:hypothetical protein